MELCGTIKSILFLVHHFDCTFLKEMAKSLRVPATAGTDFLCRASKNPRHRPVRVGDNPGPTLITSQFEFFLS